MDPVPLYLSMKEPSNLTYSVKYTRQGIDYLELSGTSNNLTLGKTIPIFQTYPRVVVPCYVDGSILSEADFNKTTISQANTFTTSLRSFYNTTISVGTPVTLYYEGESVDQVNLTQNVLMASIPRNVIIKANTNSNVTIGG